MKQIGQIEIGERIFSSEFPVPWFIMCFTESPPKPAAHPPTASLEFHFKGREPKRLK